MYGYKDKGIEERGSQYVCITKKLFQTHHPVLGKYNF